MQVEDHPVSYFQFEGVIPENNYGAGTVMVWDVGAWEPLGNPSDMLSKGDLKFRLHGQKLNGEFVLAKMRSRRPGSKGTEWLLIKKRDEAAQPRFNPDKLGYSALTERSLEEIAGDKGSARWVSNRKAATSKNRLQATGYRGRIGNRVQVTGNSDRRIGTEEKLITSIWRLRLAH